MKIIEKVSCMVWRVGSIVKNDESNVQAGYCVFGVFTENPEDSAKQ